MNGTNTYLLVQNLQLLVLVLYSELTRRVVDKCVIVPHNCHKKSNMAGLSMIID